MEVLRSSSQRFSDSDARGGEAQTQVISSGSVAARRGEGRQSQ